MDNRCAWKDYTTRGLENNHHFYIIGCNKEVFVVFNRDACDFTFCPRCGNRITMGYVGVILPPEIWGVPNEK